jgi:LmbE family N-acetylglucosaminyl deacetylase
MAERVLCVASHPDDEVLGMGATLARHIHDGFEVMVVIMADGVTSRTGAPKVSLERRRQCVAAMTVLGIELYAFGDWPDNRLDTVPMLSLAKDIEQAVQRVPAVDRLHASRQRSERRPLSCGRSNARRLRPKPSLSVKRVLHMEVASSSEWQPVWRQHFTPNYFVDVEGFMTKEAGVRSAVITRKCASGRIRARVSRV